MKCKYFFERRNYINNVFKKPKEIKGIWPNYKRKVWCDCAEDQKQFTSTCIRFGRNNKAKHNCLKNEAIDVALLMSICQYIDDITLEWLFKYLSVTTHFLFIDIPTKQEYKMMKEDPKVKFIDEWSLKRCKCFYEGLIKPYFRRIGLNIMVSRYFYPKITDLKINGQLFFEE